MSDWKPYEMIRQGYVLKDYGLVRNLDPTFNTVVTDLVQKGYIPCGNLITRCVSGALNSQSSMYCYEIQPMCLWVMPTESHHTDPLISTHDSH
jgi:hypothetical protein